MVRIRYLFVRIRLRLAGQRTLAAKDRLTAAVQDSNDTTQLLDRRYRQFLSLATKREKMAVECKRLLRLRNKSNCPILRIRLETGETHISPQAEQVLTAFDRTVFLARHQYGDWGDLPPSDWWYNNVAAQSGEGIICSRYACQDNRYIRIETDMTEKQTRLVLEDIP